MSKLENSARQKIEPVVPEWAANHPAWARLEDQLGWYDNKSIHCQNWYKRLKFIQISLAVLIPVLSHLDPACAKWATSIAGAMIAVLEGVQHMNQYSTLWFTYRATAERLKHEKFLFLSAAGPYKELTEQERLISLAEHVEEHVSTEHANWFNETRRAAAVPKKGTA
jgi:hypothetical protein